MRDKVTQKWSWYALLGRAKRTKRKQLDTGIVVERKRIGNVEHIHVIDPETIEPLKRPAFFISNRLFNLKWLWKWS